MTIADYNMLKFDDRILVAVSGGKDSVGLLHILTKIEKKYPRSSLQSVSIDEGIAGYRSEALRIAAKNCKTLDVPHSVFSFNDFFGITLDKIVTKAQKTRASTSLTPCTYCGVLRRKALDLAAEKLGASVLVLGHNLDDVVQTFLLNIVHGDVWHLSSFGVVTAETSEGSVRRVRPLCLVPEKETAFYAYAKGIRFQSVPCPYASEALRNDLRFWLERLEQKHAGSLFTAFRSFEKISKSMDLRTKAFGTCGKCGATCAEGETICMACRFLETLGVD